MFVKNAYVPIVKGKPNDLKAIEKVAASIRYGIKTLIEITPTNIKESTDKHVEYFVNLVSHYAHIGDLFVDFYGLLPEETMASGENAVISGFYQLKSKNVTVTPTYGLQRNDNIWLDLREVVSAFEVGFGFRISLDDLDDQAEDTWEQIIERSALLGLSESDIDIILDLRYIGEDSENRKGGATWVNYLKELVIDFLAYNRNASKYRSITVCGSSALKTVSSIPKDGIDEVIRVELKLWLALCKELGESVSLGFGDYGVIHPNFADSFKSKNPNAKIRYTIKDKTIYFRGHGLKLPTKDTEQYRELSKKVLSYKSYDFKCISFGDTYIYNCANFISEPGYLNSWVLADMNHHITYTAQQIQRVLQSFEESKTGPELDIAIDNF